MIAQKLHTAFCAIIFHCLFRFYYCNEGFHYDINFPRCLILFSHSFQQEDFKVHFRNISRIMDCVGCDKCRLWGKLQVRDHTYSSVPGVKIRSKAAVVIQWYLGIRDAPNLILM